MNCLKEEADRLITSVKSYSGNNQIILCPPFTLIATSAWALKGSKIKLGAQNCHSEEKGAFTGDISASQVRDAGAEYVIVGHSERRSHCGEDNKTVNKKALAAISAGLTPIICIGEEEAERDSGKTENIIKKQIEESIPKDKAGKYIIAYEPVWAIGTGKTPTSNEIAQVHSLILSLLPGAKVLYGGSVNEKNCVEIAKIPNVSGFLVGGASLDSDKFAKIMNV